MKSEWPLTRLGDLVEVKHGWPFKSEFFTLDTNNLVLPIVVAIGNFEYSGGFRFSTTQTKRYSDIFPVEYVLRAGEILLVMTCQTAGGEILGIPARIPDDGRLYLHNQRLGRVVLKDVGISNDFLYWLFLHPDFNRHLVNSATGTKILHTAPTRIESFEFKLPPLPAQKSIASVLGVIDDQIALLRETNATLEAIAQAMFKSWFVDFDPVRAKMEGRAPEGMDEATAALFPDSFEESELGSVPKGWRVLRLGDATQRITKGTTPTTLKRSFVDFGINFVKAESMTGSGGFIPEKFAYIDNKTHELLGRSQLQDGDVLISIAGTIGRIAVVTKDLIPANTNQAVALIRPLGNIFPSGLINRFLRLSESQQRMREKVVQAVQANLSLGALADLKLVVPPELVVGNLYQSGLAQIDASWTSNDQRIKTLATLRDTLLPRLISGQLRLPDVESATLTKAEL